VVYMYTPRTVLCPACAGPVAAYTCLNASLLPICTSVYVESIMLYTDTCVDLYMRYPDVQSDTACTTIGLMEGTCDILGAEETVKAIRAQLQVQADEQPEGIFG